MFEKYQTLLGIKKLKKIVIRRSKDVIAAKSFSSLIYSCMSQFHCMMLVEHNEPQESEAQEIFSVTIR